MPPIPETQSTPILNILAVAKRHFLSIIGDEIYRKWFLNDNSFITLKNVPILSCGDIGKKYLVPGWCEGWILIHDKNEILKKEVLT